MSEMSKSEERPVSPPLQKKEPKQHPCHMCPYVTSRKDNLRRHFNSFHLEKAEPEPVLDPVPVLEVPEVPEVPVVNELQLLKEELAKLRSEFELFVSKCSAPVSAPVSAQEAPKPKPKRKSKANKPVVEVADSSDELKEEVI